MRRPSRASTGVRPGLPHPGRQAPERSSKPHPGDLGRRPLAGGGVRVAQTGQGLGLVAGPAQPLPEPQRRPEVSQGLAGVAAAQVQEAERPEGQRLAVG